MPLFQYKAISSRGKVRSGNLDAANIADLEQRLLRMGLDLITCKLRNQSRPLSGVRKVRRIDLINFCFHMEQLIQAGVPLLEGLADLRDSMEHPRFREVIANLIDEVEGGKSLSAAMAEHPTVFDTLFVNLIRAGETTGQLGEVFASLTTTIKWQDELASTTKKILLFPAFVGTVVFGVTFFLMVYLVPQLVGFIKEMGGTLPFHTRALLAVSHFCVHYWYLIIIVPLAIFFVIKTMAATNSKVRYFLDNWKMKIWMIGPVLKKIMLSRFANFFAMMYAAGIPILHCLEISEGIVGNVVIKEALQEVGASIREGVSIAAGFENSGLFPPLVVRMLKIGESTGALDHALLNISYFYDRDIKDAIGKVQTMIEPAMTVVLGAILGWVMLSVLGPIYDTISKIKM
ncbi:MAG: type II secretion system F family protein [Desulfocapsaceae bacterium]|jgi:type IV pilus assembly protein PilC|nr:type II secretion system F family protein [Desulfocapsaceae bacterium]